MRSSAAADDEAVGTIASSPGCQSAGSATWKRSTVCRPTSTRLISSKIVDHGADRGVGVDEEDGSDGRRRTFARLDHAVEVGDFHPQIGDQREAHLDVLHSAVDDLVADRAQPCDVAVQSVDRESDELAVERFEFVAACREGHEFGGTDGREVRRVAEKDDPASGIIFRKADRALRSDGLERRGLVADARQGSGVQIFHIVSFFNGVTRRSTGRNSLEVARRPQKRRV